MPRFRIAISPGVTHIVDAATLADARKKTKAEIAKGTVSPFYDELFFDYETGVDPKKIKPEIAKSLRQKLGRAEISKDPDDPFKEENKILDDIMKSVQASKSPLEQEAKIQNSVGAGGYIRNTKGQLALTPKGLQLLGLPVQKRQLKDGTVINLNTIIDENSFNLKTGDLADFSGVAGPIIGTIAAFIPQTRILKTITAMLGGRERLGRTFAAGVGSVAGKAGEEYLDTQEGFQLQDKDELSDLYKEEFILGSVGQGLFGEVPGAVFKSIFGKKAPLENQRIAFVSSRNLSWADVKKLDEEAGKPLTNNQILKAAKQGKVKRFNYDLSPGFLPSRKVFDQRLPATYQAIFEQVLGNNREKANVKYLRAAVNDILNNIKDEKAALNSSLSISSKRGLDDQVDAALQKLRQQEQNVTNELRKLLDDIGESVIQVGDYGDIPANKVFGDELKSTINRARNATMEQAGAKYHAVDKKLFNFRYDIDPETGVVDNTKYTINRLGQPEPELDINGNVVLRSNLEMEKAKAINAAINEVALKHINHAQEILKKDLAKGTMQELTPPGAEISSNIRTQLANRLARAEELAKAGKYDLRIARNDADYLKRFTADVLDESDERKLVINISRVFDDYGIGKKGINNKDSILTELAEDGTKNIKKKLADKGFRLDVAEEAKIKDALDELKKANANYFERMELFDNVVMKGLVGKAGRGIIQADDVYTKALIGGSLDDLDSIFKALREYDDYVTRIDPDYAVKNANGEIIQNYYENKLKADLKNRLFSDALREATTDELTDVNFTQFAKEINRFEKEHGKFNSLFTDPLTKRNTGDLVRDTINQLNRIGFNPKPQQLRNEINNITKRNRTRGLNASEQGQAFVASLRELAKATDKRMKFERNRAITSLPDKTIDETVKTIFTPGSASTINELKLAVSDDVFNNIQQASMQKLLSKSIDLNGKGKITDLFRSQNLKTSLDSYGDETLDAMFGVETRRGLRALQQQIDVLTGGEPGRGGAAGGLVAAGLSAAIVFPPLTALPTVAGLAIARTLLTYPPFVRLMSRSDQGSISQALQIFNTTLRQFGLRYVDGEIVGFGEGTTDLLNRALDFGSEAVGLTDEEVDQNLQEGQNLFQQLREQVTAPIRELPQLPQVDTTQASVDPLSPERLDFAERIAGRPVV